MYYYLGVGNEPGGFNPGHCASQVWGISHEVVNIEKFQQMLLVES